MTQYTCQITFNGDPDFVASVPRVKRHVSSEVLPSRSYVIKFIFELSRLYCVFYFLVVIGSHVSISQKKKKKKCAQLKLTNFLKYLVRRTGELTVKGVIFL
jgi:hypothetical protein